MQHDKDLVQNGRMVGQHMQGNSNAPARRSAPRQDPWQLGSRDQASPLNLIFAYIPLGYEEAGVVLYKASWVPFHTLIVFESHSEPFQENQSLAMHSWVTKRYIFFSDAYAD
jgi:hypothetical protein